MRIHKITIDTDKGPWVVFVQGPEDRAMNRGYLLARLDRKFPELNDEYRNAIQQGKYADDTLDVID